MRGFLSRVADDLRHPQPVLAGIAAICAVAFVVLTVIVAGHPGPLAYDRPIENDIQRLDFGPFGFWNVIVSALGGFVGAIAGVVVIIIAALRARAAAPFIAVSALYSVWYNAINFTIRRPRPSGVSHLVHHLTGFSYPSGHEGFFFWCGVLFIVVFARKFPRPLYIVSLAVAAFVVVMAGISRIYVGAHWPSDVLAGLLVAVAWVFFTLSLRSLSRPLFEVAENQGRRRKSS